MQKCIEFSNEGLSESLEVFGISYIIELDIFSC